MTIAEITIVGGSTSPWSSPALWDSIVIGGVQYGWADIKDSGGSDGATTTYRGVRPGKWDITFYMWTQAQYDRFVDQIIPAILYSGTKNAANPAGIQSLSVQHPAFDTLGISSIIVEQIDAIEPVEDGPNMFTCKVHVAEYLPAPPVNTTATPSGAKNVNQPTSPGLQPSSAVLQRQAAIGALKAKIAAGG
jgi:hypothetical protein